MAVAVRIKRKALNHASSVNKRKWTTTINGQTRKRSRFLPYGVLIFLVALAVFSIPRTSSPFSSSLLSTGIGDFDVIQNLTRTQHSNETEKKIGTRTTTTKTTGSNEIPRRFIFTYKHNILTRREPDIFYRNVLNTITIYREAWKKRPDPHQDQESVSNNYQGEETLHNMTTGVIIQKPSTYNAFEGNDGDVLFFDDRECLEMIRKVEPRLILPFELEIDGSYKADICRMAALYAYGGYYFDVDIEVIQPLLLQQQHAAAAAPNNNRRSGISFVTSWTESPSHHEMFQAILAVSPQHPVIRANMDIMIQDWYFNYEVMDRVLHNESFYDPIQARKLDHLKNENNQTINLFQQVWSSKLYHNGIQKHMNNKIGGCQWSCLMGTSTLAAAYKLQHDKETNSTTTNDNHNDTNFSTYWLLEEISNKDPVRYPELSRYEHGWGCPFLVHDPLTSTPYFHSRVRGTPGCPFQ